MLNHMFSNSKQHAELVVIEKELISFYDYCKTNGFTQEEMKEICKPLNKLIKITTFYNILRKIIIGLTIILLIYMSLQLEIVSWNLSAIGRIFLIKILPFWNWESLQNEKCLIPNFGISIPTNEFYCTSCENIDSIPIETNIDPYKLSEIYLDVNVPVIIADGLNTWPAFKNQNSYNLTDILLSDKILSDTIPCELSTNMFSGAEYFDNIIKKSKIFPKWFFHFQNCDFSAVKQFRLLSPRPYFFKPEILPVQYNWLLMSKNYRIKKFKSIALKDKINVFGQIFGSSFIRLNPRLNCATECPVLEVEVQRGEALVFTSLWDLEYKPGLLENNAAIILETH